MRGNMETYAESCSHKLKLFTSFSSSIVFLKTNVYVLVFFMQNVNIRSSHQGYSADKGVLKNLTKSQENTSARVSEACNFIKK